MEARLPGRAQDLAGDAPAPGELPQAAGPPPHCPSRPCWLSHRHPAGRAGLLPGIWEPAWDLQRQKNPTQTKKPPHPDHLSPPSTIFKIDAK